MRAAKLTGYAVDEGRYISGVSIVAAPARMQNGSINALGVSEQMHRIGVAKLGEDLRERAAGLSRSFGEMALP